MPLARIRAFTSDYVYMRVEEFYLLNPEAKQSLARMRLRETG